MGVTMAVKYGGTGKLTDRIARALKQASGDRWKVTLEQDFVYVAKRQSHARHDRVAVDGYHRSADEIVQLFVERWTRPSPIFAPYQQEVRSL